MRVQHKERHMSQIWVPIRGRSEPPLGLSCLPAPPRSTNTLTTNTPLPVQTPPPPALDSCPLLSSIPPIQEHTSTRLIARVYVLRDPGKWTIQATGSPANVIEFSGGNKKVTHCCFPSRGGRPASRSHTTPGGGTELRTLHHRAPSF